MSTHGHTQQFKVRWAEEAAPVLRAGAATELVIWPLASTEQHGPHLPTGTDTIINEGIQTALIARPSDGVTLRMLPTLTIGASEHHISFGGTLSLPPIQYAQLLSQGIRCLLAQGHRHILLLNSHGGNQAPMQTALAETALEAARLRAFVGGFSYWQLCEQAWRTSNPASLGRIGHACGIETALMLHLRPELVDMAKASDDDFHVTLQQPVACGLPFDSITKQGVIGHPTAATPQMGRHLLESIAAALAEGVARWMRSNPFFHPD